MKRDQGLVSKDTGENAGKQAKAARQAKFRRHCVDFNDLFLVVYFDLCVCCKICALLKSRVPELRFQAF